MFFKQFFYLFKLQLLKLIYNNFFAYVICIILIANIAISFCYNYFSFKLLTSLFILQLIICFLYLVKYLIIDDIKDGTISQLYLYGISKIRILVFYTIIFTIFISIINLSLLRFAFLS